MHRIFRHSLISFLFFAVIAMGASLAPKPALAACTCVGDVSNLLAIKQNTGQNGALCTCLKDNLVGSVSSFPWKIPGLTGTINGAGQPKSLVEYFENVYWPRMVAMYQKLGQEQAQTNAANTHTNVQATDASNFVNYTQDLSRQRANAAVDTADRTSVVCPGASMASALTAAGVVADLNTYSYMSTYIERQGGSSQHQDVANGLVNFYNQMVAQRIELGLCNPEGNNGMDKEWCTAPKTNKSNADVNPATGPLARTFSNDKEDPTYKDYTVRMVGNLFDFIYTPFRKEQLSGGASNQVKEALFDRLKFDTQLANLRLPFAQDIARREPPAGVDEAIKKVYEEALKLIAGQPTVSPDIKKLYMSDGTPSVHSMEEMYFRGMNLDPTEYARVAGWSALNLGNVVTYQTLKTMHSVVLLYDIRQEMRQTNRLLGTIGSILASDRHQAIESKIQAISGN